MYTGGIIGSSTPLNKPCFSAIGARFGDRQKFCASVPCYLRESHPLTRERNYMPFQPSQMVQTQFHASPQTNSTLLRHTSRNFSYGGRPPHGRAQEAQPTQQAINADRSNISGQLGSLDFTVHPLNQMFDNLANCRQDVRTAGHFRATGEPSGPVCFCAREETPGSTLGEA